MNCLCLITNIEDCMVAHSCFPQVYSCHVWLPDEKERVIVGTDQGELLLCEGGEVRPCARRRQVPRRAIAFVSELEFVHLDLVLADTQRMRNWRYIGQFLWLKWYEL